MLEYRAEGLCRNANHLRREELYHCITTGEVLQSTALAFDTERRLRFELGGQRAYMPFEECVDVGPQEEIKDIAVLTRVGRPTCFVITGTEVDENGEEVFLLSRSLAQRLCRRQYLDTLEAGSVIPCTVTHIENFGAFCDIGCGIAALLPIDCLSVSRISSPADRVQVGQQLLCAIKNRDPQGRIVLTLRELLGTWSENAACFAPGETVVGIVRSVEDYGVFIEIAPNLAGLAEADRSLDGCETVCQDLLEVLLIWLVRCTTISLQLEEAAPTENRECAEIKRYLDTNYREDISLDLLAELAHLNKYYLAHTFQREYGISPITYLNRRRIEESKHMLGNTSYSLAQISELMGFSSPSYFSQCFRKAEGMTPNEYGRQTRQGKRPAPTKRHEV